MARLSRRATEQLRQIAEQSPSNESFGPPLREALGEQDSERLEQALGRLSKSSEPGERQQAAGEASEGLKKITSAFDASVPSTLADVRQRRSLLPRDSDAIASGLQPLQSAARRQSQGRPLSRRQRGQVGREAVRNLSTGIPDMYGHNERSDQALSQLEQKLNDLDFPLDLKTVQELTRDVQQLGREVVVPDQPEAPAEIQSIDPSRLPPDYRDAIEKYFEKLSEQ